MWSLFEKRCLSAAQSTKRDRLGTPRNNKVAADRRDTVNERLKKTREIEQATVDPKECVSGLLSVAVVFTRALFGRM